MDDPSPRPFSFANLRAGGSVYLLVVLLVTFIAIPILQTTEPLDWLFPNSDEHVRKVLVHAASVAVLVTAAVTVAHTEHPLLVVVALITIPTAVEVADAVGTTPPDSVRTFARAYTGCALLYVVARGVKVMFARRTVTADMVTLSLCAYLLIGLAWMYFYQAAFIENREGAFGGLAVEQSARDESGFFYFSFVTLTTLGYGDITPTGAVARSLATVQAIIGQMFVAVVLARLVGLQIASAATGRSVDDDPREEAGD